MESVKRESLDFWLPEEDEQKKVRVRFGTLTWRVSVQPYQATPPSACGIGRVRGGRLGARRGTG